MNYQELENWHDYEVSSRREIVALLRRSGEKHQLVRMLVKGEADVCITAVLDVDPDTNSIVLDRSVERLQNERILEAGTVHCETSLDKIRILFSVENLRYTLHQGKDALRADLPSSLIRLQRREYYRMETPVSNPVRAVIPLPPALGTGSGVFPLHDISCGGVAILDNKLQLGAAIGTTIRDCRIELPETGPVIVSLQVRNVLDFTLLNNKTNRRFGMQFVDLSRGGMAGVQRFITKLERERNARLAGLA
ncbi:flagellar brake protein YcgR [Massilia varians]|uniref:Flagellar brake protein YcgR n=1 Tax=Massilia varians TaxID=457921 RepID=A0ABM8CB79_9BURK|nr:flagellar brake protein [Massilia varians]BDT60564.1 flagellar brake protein YcgR [Massilia varians]